ncbi:MAG: MFS transporter [Chloroflexia bacterium]|nr:MFS transporter [Chloroflexia bacterium]
MRSFILRFLGFSRDIKLFLFYSLLANIGFGVYQLIFNLYLYELDFREDAIGLFSAIQTLAMAGTAISLGMLLRRFGTWRCIAGGVAIYGVACLGLALSSAGWLIAPLSALAGVGMAFIFTTTMPFLIEWARYDQRAEASAVAFSVIALAATLGALIGGVAPTLLAALPGVESGSAGAFRAVLLVGTVVTFCGLAPLLRMGDVRRGKPVAAHDAADVTESPADRRQSRRDLVVFVAVGGLMALGAGMVVPFYNVYLFTLGASARDVGFVYALGGLAAAVCGLWAPALSRRLGSLQAVLVVRSAGVPIYLLLILVPSYGIAVFAHLVRQTSIAMAWPIDSTFIAEVLPARHRAAIFGWRSGAWNLGWSVASLAGGWLIVVGGYNWPFLGFTVFSLAAAAVYYLYFGRHPKVRAGDVPSALPRHRRARAAAASPDVAVDREEEAPG